MDNFDIESFLYFDDIRTAFKEVPFIDKQGH